MQFTTLMAQIPAASPGGMDVVRRYRECYVDVVASFSARTADTSLWLNIARTGDEFFRLELSRPMLERMMEELKHIEDEAADWDRSERP